MPWVKLSDDWYDDPRVVEAGDDGGWLWVIALSWSARNLTDGHIPSRQLSRLTTLDDPPTVAARLVDLGLFAVDTERGGWVVANFHRYQPTAAEVKAKREAEAERKRRVRTESGRTTTGRPHGVRGVSDSPGPGPVPLGKPPSSSTDSLGADPAVDEVMDLIADRRLAAEQAAGKVRSAKAWRQRVRDNLPAELGDEIREALAAWDEPPHVIAEVVEGARNKHYLKRREAIA